MAENGGNSDKATGDDPSVLGSLPSTRPTRLSRHARAEEAGAETVPRKAGPGAEAGEAPAKAKASGARPKAVKPPAKAVADSPTAKAQAAAAKAPAAETSRPQAIRAGHPTLSEPPADHPSSTPGGVQAVKGVVRAAGGLASAGLTLGGHVLKWVFARLPKP